jgi:hypothetical protein
MRYQLRYVRMLPTGLNPAPPGACQNCSRLGKSGTSRPRAHGRSLAIIWSSASSTFIQRVSFPGRTMS